MHNFNYLEDQYHPDVSKLHFAYNVSLCFLTLYKIYIPWMLVEGVRVRTDHHDYFLE